MDRLWSVLVKSTKYVCCGVCFALTAFVLFLFVCHTGKTKAGDQVNPVDYAVADRFARYMNNSISDALDGVLSIEKVYWLSDSDLVAPEPNPECYGTSNDPEVLQSVIDSASDLLDGQQLLFKPDTPIYQDTTVSYYHDPTILAITWKQLINDTVYNISEIKIADSSQFRRFLSDGEYSSGSKYLTSEMASSVNAVVATNGDYYAMRKMGTIVYNSQVMRAEGHRMDTCFIDSNGDMQFVYAREMTEEEDICQYVQENGIRFSLAFGPVLIEDGKVCNVNKPYPVGELDIPNARAALCQMDSLHYLMVIASVQPPYDDGIMMLEFAETLETFGCKMAYNLDGGRSASLAVDGKLQNYVYERLVSDIIYFATAIPNGEK